MLDIPSVTLRAWENRYSAVNPIRTESGYRVYSDENIEDLRWLKEQVEVQHINISQAVRMLKARKEETARVHSLSTLGLSTTTDAYQNMRDQIFQKLLHFQGEQANALIDFGFSMYGYEAMFYQILVPLLVRVGDEWEEGKASVAQEHYMTGLISQRFYQFFHVFPINTHLPKVLSFCPEGEFHHVGLLLFSLFLRKNGLEVLYLGANTPMDGVMQIIAEQNIQMVCMAVSNPIQVPSCDALVTQMTEKYPNLLFVLGGKGYENAEKTMYPKWVITEPSEEWQTWFNDSGYFGAKVQR